MESSWQILVSLAAGLGLAAACGFRVFVPLLALSAATRAQLLTVSDEMAWLGSTPALVCLGVATVLEVGAYYIPVVDNLLDSIATPASALAGAIVASSVVTDIDPALRWTLVAIAGAGVATAIQLPSVLIRGTSTVSTAGVGNPVVSTGEAAGATATSALAIFAPILVPIFLVLVIWASWYLLGRRRRAEAPC